MRINLYASILTCHFKHPYDTNTSQNQLAQDIRYIGRNSTYIILTKTYSICCFLIQLIHNNFFILDSLKIPVSFLEKLDLL